MILIPDLADTVAFSNSFTFSFIKMWSPCAFHPTAATLRRPREPRRKLSYSNRMSATDVWGDVFISERLNGEVGLYKVTDTKAYDTLQLPLGRLGVLRTFTASPDLKWLAMSSRTRGGVWDLDTNTRIFHIRAFQNAYYNANGNFFMDFPEFEKAQREMGVLSPVTQQSKGREIDKDDDLTFFGDVFLRTKHNDKNRNVRRNFVLESLDMATGKLLWSRNFPKQGPWVSGKLRDHRSFP